MKKLSILLFLVSLLTACQLAEKGLHAQKFDPLDMSSCRELTAVEASGQADYLGVFPGVTQMDEVAVLLGPPEFEYGVEDRPIWNYWHPSVNVYFAGDIVEKISVEQSPELVRLQDYLEKYGCPAAVFGTKDPGITDEDLEGEISWPVYVFVYNEMGLEVVFYNLRLERGKIPLDHYADQLHYRVADAVDVFVEMNYEAGRDLVSWDRVVADD